MGGKSLNESNNQSCMWELLSFATQKANDDIDFKISTRNRSYTKFIVINKPLGGLHHTAQTLAIPADTCLGAEEK